MNKVVLMGRLTRDPEVKYNEGNAIARYTIAVNRRYSKETQEKADFINCTAFGKAAEFTEKYLHKGIKILISGRIQTGSYTNKEGRKVYTTDVIIEEQDFAESKGAAGQELGEHSRPASTQDEPGFMDIPDGVQEELPFQ